MLEGIANALVEQNMVEPPGFLDIKDKVMWQPEG
jgi:hypothetical protein